MRKLLVALVIAGCSSESGGGGQATTIVDPDLIVATMTHQKVGITVYKTTDFLMTGDCRTLRGEISDSELDALKGYMADEVIQTLGKECGEGEYRITIGGRPSVCWTGGQKSPALEGLTAFFDDKAEKLAATPQGKCDGTPQTVGESNWAKDKAAAGSGK